MRYEKIDAFRGFVIINMIAYHALWDLVYMYGFPFDWYRSHIGYIWQQGICWSFILLSGFCFLLGKKRLRRGLQVFLSGLLVTVVTLIAMPNQRVVFGVLTFIGSAMLLMILLEKGLQYVPQIPGAIISFGLFLMSKHMAAGYIGIQGVCTVELPRSWYANLVTTYLGLPTADFYSTDYFALFPWMFLFITGYFLYRIADRYDLLKCLQNGKIEPLNRFGRFSLFIYLLHQPLIYGILEIFL